MVGDHTHIFWGCPKIKVYWNNIKKEMDKIFRTDILLDPLSTLLDITQEQMFNRDQCYIIPIDTSRHCINQFLQLLILTFLSQ